MSTEWKMVSAAPPAPSATSAAPGKDAARKPLTDKQWLDLAARHSHRDWGDRYLDSIKAVCMDYAALSQEDRS